MICLHVCTIVVLLVITSIFNYSTSKRILIPDDLKGSFWHISDLHVDQNYSRSGDPNDMCHEGLSKKSRDNGYFGNFLCDASEILVNLTIKDMKRLEPNPDFIIWTGDNIAHTRNPHPDWYAVFETIKNITTLLKENFPSTKIFPCIGNHDSFPPNLLTPSSENGSVYDDYLKKGHWQLLLDKDTWDTFKKGGFYSFRMSRGLRIISLNTILWYSSNSLVKNLSDPAGQLDWFEEELENASKSGDKVYIIGHVAPGFYNRVPPGKLSLPTYHMQYLRRYLKIVKEHPSVIAGQMFGHVHNDMFQLFYCDTGNVLSSSLIGSSVSPWHTTNDKFNESLPVNPSIRLMRYDKMKKTLLDYRQYFFNLTHANSLKKFEEASFEPLYNFSSTYDVPDLSTQSLFNVYEKLKSSPKLYNTFFKYLTAAEVSVPCDDKCRFAQLCSMSGTSEMEYSTCMQTNIISNGTTDNGEHSPSHAVTYGIVFLCCSVLIICATIIYFKTKPRCQNQEYFKFSNF